MSGDKVTNLKLNVLQCHCIIHMSFIWFLIFSRSRAHFSMSHLQATQTVNFIPYWKAPMSICRLIWEVAR